MHARRLGKIARCDVEVGRGSVLSPATVAVGASAEAVKLKVKTTILSARTVLEPHRGSSPHFPITVPTAAYCMNL